MNNDNPLFGNYDASLIRASDDLGTVTPLGFYLLILPEKPKNITKSGIALPDSVKIFNYRGRVLAISKILESSFEEHKIPLEARISVGNTVIFRITGIEMPSDVESENSNILVPYGNIMARVEKPDARRPKSAEPVG